MESTPVRVGVMDSAKAGLVVSLPLRKLSAQARALRVLTRIALVSGAGLVILFVPIVHVCGLVIALVAGPIAGAFAWRDQVLFGGGEVPCPKCAQAVVLPKNLAGWPARVHCAKCGAMVELTPGEENKA
jgi:hypothetical protein